MTVIPGYEMLWVSYAQVTYPSLGTQSKWFLLRVGMKKFSESKIQSAQSEEKDLPVGQMVKNLPARQETWVRSLDGKILWRREWEPTPVFLPGESHGQRSLAGYSLWGCKELNMTE